MSNKKKNRLHILGAGPAGLALGHYAKKKNIDLKITYITKGTNVLINIFIDGKKAI